MATTITWDAVGERFYESGLDRAVLYVNKVGYVWNGLVSLIEKEASAEPTPLYFDGVKYAEATPLQDFGAVLKAYTYPDEFLVCEGVVDAGNGMYVTGQYPESFGLTYRTKVGNDESGLDLGYKIHILYNLSAAPTAKTHTTLSNTETPELFEWNITAVPANINGYYPTAHFIFDSRQMSPVLLSDLETTLYGDGTTTPVLPDPETLASFIGEWVIMRITDHGDGSWTADGPDAYFTIVGTEFEINQANAKMVDADTYLISDKTY